MSTIRAKFVVNSVTLTTYGKTVECSAVYSNAGENADYSKATPNGGLKLTIDKETTAYCSEMFTPGAYIYIDITKAPEK